MALRPPASIPCLLLAMACFLPSAVVYSAADWRYVQPHSGSRTTLTVDGKKRTYHPLNIKKPVVVKVTGPTTLRLVTRAECLGEETIYSFLVTRDGAKRYHIARVTSPDPEVHAEGNSRVKLGSSRTATFKVPAGEHTYEISLPAGAKGGVYVRPMVLESAKSPASYVAFLPKSFAEEVRVAVREAEYLYYRGAQNKPLELEVVGPTKLKIVSRLEFDYTMRGEKSYRVQVVEGGKVMATKVLKAKPSALASYVGKSTRVLSEGSTFYLKVPTGRHAYQLTLPDPGVSAVFRFYLPQKDLGNEPPKTGANRMGMLLRMKPSAAG